MLRPLVIGFAFLAQLYSGPGSAEVLRLYIDGDYSVSAEGSEAIELGVRTALAEHDGRVGPFEIEVQAHDSRLNAKRSERLFNLFSEDPHALAVIGGTYSPPYLTLRDSINERGLLTLLPWSAAGPITRSVVEQKNFIFRLSVDDWKAGPFLVQEALDVRGCQRVGLLTTDTGWGRSNRSTVTDTMRNRGIWLTEDIVFNDDLGDAQATQLAEDLSASGIDCLILIAGTRAGAMLLSSLAVQPHPPRVISHWGILTGNFTQRVTAETREALDLVVLQTCGLKAETERSERFSQTLARVQVDGRLVHSIADIPAAAGFVHGYDLTLVLLAALDQALTQNNFPDLSASERRLLVKLALEALETPVDGLLMTYETPFEDPRSGGVDAHEALGGQDLCMAKFDGIKLVSAQP